MAKRTITMEQAERIEEALTEAMHYADARSFVRELTDTGLDKKVAKSLGESVLSFGADIRVMQEDSWGSDDIACAADSMKRLEERLGKLFNVKRNIRRAYRWDINF